MRKMFAFVAVLPLAGAAPPTADLAIKVDNLRSTRGLIHACITASRAHFPACEKDPKARKATAPASARLVKLTGLPTGPYAVAIFHDQNSNRKMDKMMGIPREGFGFSRSPVVRFGPPKFEQVVITLGPGLTQQTIRIQYIL